MSANQAPAVWLSPVAALTRFAGRGDLRLERSARVEEQSIPRYGFEVGNIALLLAEATETELVESTEPTPLPNTEPWLRGLVNLRGNLVPVFDLAQLFEMAPAFDDSVSNVVPFRRTVLLVLGDGERMVGIELENLPRACASENLQRAVDPPSPPARLAPFVPGAWLEGDQLWLEFEHEEFFESLRESIEAA